MNGEYRYRVWHGVEVWYWESEWRPTEKSQWFKLDSGSEKHRKWAEGSAKNAASKHRADREATFRRYQTEWQAVDL